MTSYEAVSIVEGFCEGENTTREHQLAAWQHLIDSGLCWNLQGWFGRTAQALIDKGLCKAA